jgi:BirA family biotin operon repressor/biotin-[acetyl-CoA-carboxylase] ligase
VISWRLERYEELASTSDFCIERAKAGEPEGLAVFAARQSAGRGSRGRSWLSPPGNVALSVLLRPETSPAQSSMFPLLCGIATVDAITGALSSGPVPMLKWPNDVLLNGQKCAGLLIDATQAQARFDWLVIGIGINVAYAPELPGRATTCLAAEGAVTTAIAVAEAVLDQLSIWLAIFHAAGSTQIVPSWLSRAHPVGTHLEVKTPHQTAAGTFAGLTQAGELLLNVKNRIQTYRTGEILLGART